MPDEREVVITGMGAVTPLGVGVEPLWAGVRAGKSGIDWFSYASELNPEQFPVRYGGEVKNFDVDRHLVKHCEVRLEPGIQFGLVAAQEALRQAKLIDDRDELVDRDVVISLLVGSGHGSSYESEIASHAFAERGVRGLRPSSVARCMFNALSSNISIHFGLRGTNHTIASACASANAAIGIAYRDIKHGYADIVLCGGADSPFVRAMFGGWTSLRVLARHEDPAKACRPFDKHRTGMAIGEGAGLLVLESRVSAERRGVSILAKVVGYGTSSDAYNLTAPSKEGQTVSIRRCLNDAGVAPMDVDYINLHGTGTKANDEAEAHAIFEVFGSRGDTLPCSSIKPAVGHSMGAIGGIEAIVTVQAIRDQFVPPTLNCDEPDPDIGLDYVPNVGRGHSIKRAMSNSFAFGGNNAVLMLEAER